MIPAGAVTRNKDIGRVVALAKHVVVSSHEVLQRRGEDVLRNRSDTVARCDEDAFLGSSRVPRVGGDRTEQLRVEFDERRFSGVSGDVAPAVDEEEDAGVINLGIGLRLWTVAAESVEVDGNTLWFFEYAAVEEGVWLWGRGGDLNADCDVRGNALWIRASSAFVHGLGGA